MVDTTLIWFEVQFTGAETEQPLGNGYQSPTLKFGGVDTGINEYSFAQFDANNNAAVQFAQLEVVDATTVAPTNNPLIHHFLADGNEATESQWNLVEVPTSAVAAILAANPAQPDDPPDDPSATYDNNAALLYSMGLPSNLFPIVPTAPPLVLSGNGEIDQPAAQDFANQISQDDGAQPNKFDWFTTTGGQGEITVDDQGGSSLSSSVLSNGFIVETSTSPSSGNYTITITTPNNHITVATYDQFGNKIGTEGIDTTNKTVTQQIWIGDNVTQTATGGPGASESVQAGSSLTGDSHQPLGLPDDINQQIALAVDSVLAGATVSGQQAIANTWLFPETPEAQQAAAPASVPVPVVGGGAQTLVQPLSTETAQGPITPYGQVGAAQIQVVNTAARLPAFQQELRTTPNSFPNNVGNNPSINYSSTIQMLQTFQLQDQQFHPAQPPAQVPTPTDTSAPLGQITPTMIGTDLKMAFAQIGAGTLTAATASKLTDDTASFDAVNVSLQWIGQDSSFFGAATGSIGTAMANDLLPKMVIDLSYAGSPLTVDIAAAMNKADAAGQTYLTLNTKSDANAIGDAITQVYGHT